MLQRISIAAVLTAFAAAGCTSSGNSGAVPPFQAVGGANPGALRQAMEKVKIKSYNDLPVYSSYYGPAAITQTAGSLWVADDIDQDFGECVVVQIAPSGKMVNAFYYPGRSTEGASFLGMTVGSDGALWLTDEYNEQILRLTASGGYTGFPLSNYSAPYEITAGPDKALWFTLASGTKGPGIGRITTGGHITVYYLSSQVWDITTGPDGALWFTEPQADRVGRITTHGKITEYSNGISAGAQPYSIAAGPDGALWFTELAGGRIGRITTAGSVTEYSKGITPTEQPLGLAAGPDGAIWFTEYETYGSYQVRASKIGRITTHGRITEYAKGLDPRAAPAEIVAGPDGNMWFVEQRVDRTGRVKL